MLRSQSCSGPKTLKAMSLFVKSPSHIVQYCSLFFFKLQRTNIRFYNLCCLVQSISKTCPESKVALNTEGSWQFLWNMLLVFFYGQERPQFKTWIISHITSSPVWCIFLKQILGSKLDRGADQPLWKNPLLS